MTAPLIGITTYGRDDENKFPLPGEYVDAVRRAGGIAVLIPPGETSPEPLLTRLDGLILAGGGDLDPSRYNGIPHESVYMVDSERDHSELDLAKHAIECGFPTLGICRGTQVINVALGGTLHEHLPEFVGEQVKHRLPPREPTPHAIRIKAGSRLGEILKSYEFEAASWHHQAIQDVGEGLTIVAHAPDGIVEAIEKHDHPWLVAVQWHPELTAAIDPIQQRLFDVFVEAAITLRAESG